MSSKVIGQIESKTYDITKDRNTFEIIERGSGYQHHAFFSEALLSWIRTEISSIHYENSKLGHVETKRDNDSTATISVKANQRGRFAAIMVVANRYHRGYETICVPFGTNGVGLKSFLELLRKILPTKKAPSNLRHDSTETNFTDTRAVITKLKNTCLVVKLSDDKYEWRSLPEDLGAFFPLSMQPTIKPIGTRLFLLQCAIEADMEIIAKLETINLWDCKIEFHYWRPGYGTITWGVLRKMNRWVLLVGIPVHLMSLKFIQSILKPFGTINELRQPSGISLDFCCIEALIENCDIIKLPSFINVQSLENNFPIRVVPAVPELRYRRATSERPQSMQQQQNDELTRSTPIQPNQASRPMLPDLETIQNQSASASNPKTPCHSQPILPSLSTTNQSLNSNPGPTLSCQPLSLPQNPLANILPRHTQPNKSLSNPTSRASTHNTYNERLVSPNLAVPAVPNIALTTTASVIPITEVTSVSVIPNTALTTAASIIPNTEVTSDSSNNHNKPHSQSQSNPSSLQPLCRQPLMHTIAMPLSHDLTEATWPQFHPLPPNHYPHNPNPQPTHPNYLSGSFSSPSNPLYNNSPLQQSTPIPNAQQLFPFGIPFIPNTNQPFLYHHPATNVPLNTYNYLSNQQLLNDIMA